MRNSNASIDASRDFPAFPLENIAYGPCRRGMHNGKSRKYFFRVEKQTPASAIPIRLQILIRLWIGLASLNMKSAREGYGTYAYRIIRDRMVMVFFFLLYSESCSVAGPLTQKD